MRLKALPAVGLTCLITACAAERSAELPPALTGSEITETLTSQALTRCGRRLLSRWTYTGTHSADGTMTGRIGWPDGSDSAEGVWETAEGLYCRQWGNHWGGGQRGCFRVARDGRLLIFDHVSGSAGDASRYVYSLDGACP